MVIIFAVVVFIFISTILVVGYILSSSVIRPELYTVQAAWDCDVALGKIDEEKFNALTKEEVWITANDGIQLYGLFISNGNSSKTVIMLHGVTFTHAGSIKYMNMFLSRGFNILLLDHRAHGLSGGSYITFGFREKYDISSSIDWLKNRFGKDCTIGIHGESMGAAIALQSAAVDHRVEFVIADSSFSDLRQLLIYQIGKKFHLPSFPFISAASLMMRLRCGMILKQVSPVNSVRTIQCPVLFIHGGADDFILPSMALELFEAKQGEKEIYIAEGSIHADNFWTHKEEYDRRVGAFLKKIQES